MKKIYVAHPFGGKIENMLSVETLVRKMVKHNPNILCISPIHATGYLYNDVEYEVGMNYCFELLKLCDELLLCKGWENSRGCNMEKEFAEEHGIPINYVLDFLKDCVDCSSFYQNCDTGNECNGQDEICHEFNSNKRIKRSTLD
jgi:hypothetical protein